MENPHELFGVDAASFNPGAVFQAPSPLAAHYAEVAESAAPFDWSTTYDVEALIAQKLVTPGLKIPIKNQGQSGSCGGQSESYLGEMIGALHLGNFEEKSAKFTYAPVAVPGGGSAGDTLAARAENFGWGSELLTPSYENGQPPTEEFMEQYVDITSEATEHAKIDRALSSALVSINIDSIAQAARDNVGVRIGIAGSNNGTWLSEFPQPPKAGETLWYHWVTVSKAEMRNGVKMVGFPNSWGITTGNQGWQWIDANYVTPAHIFEARAYVFNNTPIPPAFKHTFTEQLDLGATGPEVTAVQTALQINGEFPANIKPTGYFGAITQTALKAFQTKYGLSPVGRVGPLTIAELNKLFSN